MVKKNNGVSFGRKDGTNYTRSNNATKGITGVAL